MHEGEYEGRGEEDRCLISGIEEAGRCERQVSLEGGKEER